MRSLAVAVTLGLALLVPLAPAGAAAPFPTLVEIRAAHHPGFDRIVFEFDGGLPERTTARWVDRVTRDPSGLPLAVQGNAFIAVVLGSANVFGGFVVTDRMLEMFKRKPAGGKGAGAGGK